MPRHGDTEKHSGRSPRLALAVQQCRRSLPLQCSRFFGVLSLKLWIFGVALLGDGSAAMAAAATADSSRRGGRPARRQSGASLAPPTLTRVLVPNCPPR